MTDESSPDLPAVHGELVTPGAGAGPDPAGALGGLDLGSLLDMAGQMQQQMAAAQQEAAETVIEGSAGGQAVRVEVSGAGEFQRVTISPDVVGDDIDMLQDLILAAVRDAMDKVHALQSESMGGLGGGLPDLGSLGDLLGG